MTEPAPSNVGAPDGGEVTGAPVPDAPLTDSPQPIQHRQRAGLSHEEIDILVAAAREIRDRVKQEDAPPVNEELIRLATSNQLPEELAIMVQRLGIRYKTWGDALEIEETRQLAIEAAASTN